ncbi:conserved hypothetical protein [Vibrio chagasii]|nr:conserved hypothetical protein [Vibrio chagasii]
MDIEGIDEIGLTVARESNDAFIFERGVFVFDDREDDKFFSESLGFEHIAAFSTPQLALLRYEAREDLKVVERREIAIEKGVRGTSIYNEGVRYGAQYGYSHTISQFNSLVSQSESELFRVYDFSSLMIGGGVVVPPVIVLSKDTVLVTENTYTHKAESYDVHEDAYFSRTAPTFYDYLNLPPSDVREPSKYSIPLTDNELTHWANGVYEGWIRGRRMAHNEITSNINSLTRDFFGMVRYHVLLKYGIVDAPVVSRDEQAVISDGTGMDVGVTTLHLRKLQTFNPQSHLWKALPKIDKLEQKYLKDDRT